MKKCQQCGRVYDDSQSFCVEDGTTLLADTKNEITETVVLPGKKSKLPGKKSKLPLILISLLLLIGISVTVWLWFAFRPSNEAPSNKQVAVNVQTPVSTPTPLSISTPTPLPSLSPSPTISSESNTNVSNVSNATPETVSNSKLANESNPAKLPSLMKAEEHSVVFNLQQCRKSGTSITCDFTMTNTGQDRQLRLPVYQCKLFDELGNGYKGSEAQVANQTGDSPEIGFINGVTAKAQMTFDNIEPNAARITLLNFGFSVGNDYNLAVKFRNVPLTISK